MRRRTRQSLVTLLIVAAVIGVLALVFSQTQNTFGFAGLNDWGSATSRGKILSDTSQSTVFQHEWTFNEGGSTNTGNANEITFSGHIPTTVPNNNDLASSNGHLPLQLSSSLYLPASSSKINLLVYCDGPTDTRSNTPCGGDVASGRPTIPITMDVKGVCAVWDHSKHYKEDVWYYNIDCRYEGRYDCPKGYVCTNAIAKSGVFTVEALKTGVVCTLTQTGLCPTGNACNANGQCEALAGLTRVPAPGYESGQSSSDSASSGSQQSSTGTPSGTPSNSSPAPGQSSFPLVILALVAGGLIITVAVVGIGRLRRRRR